MKFSLSVLISLVAVSNAMTITITRSVPTATSVQTETLYCSPTTDENGNSVCPPSSSNEVATSSSEASSPSSAVVSSSAIPTSTEAATSTPTTSSVQRTSSAATFSAAPSSIELSYISSAVASSSAPSSAPSASPSSSQTSTASDVSSSKALGTFEQQILDEHNKKRALHNVQSLTWNWTLADYAADYAAKAFDCNNVQLIHSSGPYGENLAAGYVGGIEPTDAWYDEIKDYDYNNPGFSEATGHFTQLVWKTTAQLGCAMVKCDNEWRQYTICEYNPRGNLVSSNPSITKEIFTDNVPPLAS